MDNRRTASHRAGGLVAGAVLGVTSSWNLTNVGAVAETVAVHYGIPLASVGLFTTVMFLAQMLLHIPGGRLIDRFGPRRMGVVGLATIVAGNLAILGGLPATPAVAVRFAIGFGMGVCFVGGASYIRAFGGASFAQGMYGGLALGAGGLALAFVPPATTWLGWRGPFITAAVAAVLGLVALAAAPPPGSAPTASEGRVVWRLLTDPRVLRFAAMHAATFGISIILGNWIVSLLVRNGGYSESVAGAAGSLVLLGGLVGRPLGGALADRYPEQTRRIVMGSMLAGAAATAIVTAAQPLWLVVAASLGIGLAAGLPFGPVFTAAPQTHPEAPAAVLGALSTPAVATVVVGTPLVGLTFGLEGNGRLGFLAIAACWAVAILAVPSVRAFAARPRT